MRFFRIFSSALILTLLASCQAISPQINDNPIIETPEPSGPTLTPVQPTLQRTNTLVPTATPTLEPTATQTPEIIGSSSIGHITRVQEYEDNGQVEDALKVTTAEGIEEIELGDFDQGTARFRILELTNGWEKTVKLLLVEKAMIDAQGKEVWHVWVGFARDSDGVSLVPASIGKEEVWLQLEARHGQMGDVYVGMVDNAGGIIPLFEFNNNGTVLFVSPFTEKGKLRLPSLRQLYQQESVGVIVLKGSGILPEISLPEDLLQDAMLVKGESGWVLQDPGGGLLYRLENGEWADEVPDVSQFETVMRESLEARKPSFRIKDPNSMVVTVDLPTSEEVKVLLQEGLVIWDWEVRGFTRLNPQTQHEQVLRFYYEEGEVKREGIEIREQWNDIADRLEIPGWGTMTIEGDIAALAIPGRSGRPSMRNLQLNHNEDAIERWIAGLTYLFGDQAVLNLFQVESFDRVGRFTEAQTNLTIEKTDIRRGITIEIATAGDKKQAVEFGRSFNIEKGPTSHIAPNMSSWFYRTEAGRLIVTHYYQSKQAGNPLPTFSITNTAVLNWLRQNPDYSKIAYIGRGYVLTYGIKSVTGALMPGLAETMSMFFDTDPQLDRLSALYQQFPLNKVLFRVN